MLDSLKIRFVVSTRESEENFHKNTLTGKSIKLFNFPFLELRLFPENREGLSKVYNIAINESAKNPAILVFIPGMKDYVKEGFEILNTLPEWYQYLLFIAISASFGIKGVGQAAKMLRKK